MNATTTETGRIEYRSATTDRGAVIHPWDSNLTAFGRWEGDRFVCAHFKPSRGYKSVKSAERQIARWMAA